MSRTTEFVGLSKNAEIFIKRKGQRLICHRLVMDIYPDGRIDQETKPIYEGIIRRNSGKSKYTATGIGHEEIPLDQYYDTETGRIYDEAVQHEPWNSGPIIFTALKDRSTDEWVKETVWTDQDIENFVGPASPSPLDALD